MKKVHICQIDNTKMFDSIDSTTKKKKDFKD